MRSVARLAMACVLGAAAAAAKGEESVAALGREHAERSAIAWQVRDIEHPRLGAIRYAVQRHPVITAAPGGNIVSRAYVSCEKDRRTVAIELANAPESDPAGGLRPTVRPRLACIRPPPGSPGAPESGEIEARWEIGPLGDALATGLAPGALRRCAWIDVLQDVLLPSGPLPGSQRIAMQIAPFDRALDAVFAACGEPGAIAPAETAASAAPAPASPSPAPGEALGWKRARTIAKGRTNVRAAARLEARVVTLLEPGTPVLVRRATSPWWAVRPRGGAGFAGYVREDRLAFE